MVAVYFESSCHAEVAAIFDDEKTYDLCFPVLEKLAKENRMIVTENVTEKDINDLV